MRAARRSNMPLCHATGLLVLAGLALSADPSWADVSKEQCRDADTSAQSLRQEKKFSEARKQLDICLDKACPSIVRNDCAQRLDDLERAQPKIAFMAKDGAGKDLVEVKVTLDGRPFAQRLDGTALAADPGEHTFTFEVAGQAPVIQHIVLHEGEASRTERVVMGTPPPPAAESTATMVQAATPAPPTPSSTPGATVTAGHPANPPAQTGEALTPPSASWGTQRVIAAVVGGAGVAGAIFGSALGVSAASSLNAARGECTVTSCTNAGHDQAVHDCDNATTAANASTVAFIAAGVLVAGGLVLYLTAPSTASTKTEVLEFAPTLVAGGGGLFVRGGF